MNSPMNRHLLLLTAAAAAIAACSSPAPVETQAVALMASAEPTVLAEIAQPPVIDEPSLDGAPPVVVAPPPVVKAPPPMTRVQSARLSCVIDVDRTPRGIRITPIVKSGRSLSGEYSLVITKDGAGGSSDISQGGPFDAARGERLELASSEISLERDARYRAVLKVRADGREICREISS